MLVDNSPTEKEAKHSRNTSDPQALAQRAEITSCLHLGTFSKSRLNNALSGGEKKQHLVF